ncbi:MAG: bifunctional nuclease family protein [Planctomycetes bacterium]|nr:bifunctional nuclease family protein [Planctomycetota bacterium]
MTMVRFSLARVVLADTQPSQKIVLKEQGGVRHFTIEIGEPEAVAIYRRAMKRFHPRPLTHDLLDNVIAGMGGTVKAVEITDLKDHTYYANLVIQTADGEVRVDARPSDAIAILVGANVDLFVDDERVLAPLYGDTQ